MTGLARTAARHSSFGCSTHSRAVHKSDSYARRSLSLPNRKRYKVRATTDRWNNAKQAEEFPYRKRYKVTCDGVFSRGSIMIDQEFQYRKRYEVTCDSVSGRPQKQKAQIMVLENLLETEHVIALFRLSLHTQRVCNDPAKPYIARLAAIRGKSENPPRFFTSERFSYSSYCSMVSPFCQTKTASHFKRKGTPLNICPESSDIDARYARCDET